MKTRLSRAQQGSINILLVPLLIATVLLIASLAFGFWAYSSRQDYKDNSDQKSAAAVKVAEDQTATKKDNEFIEREKQPLKLYKGPSEFGALNISYPKTWSAYVDENGSGSTPINGFFHPGFVPGVTSGSSVALRVQVVGQSFDEVVKSFDADVKNAKATVAPYKPVNVPNIVGLQVTGKIATDKQGVMVVIPLRDKTIKLWTEADQFKGDFTNNILANFSFTP